MPYIHTGRQANMGTHTKWQTIHTHRHTESQPPSNIDRAVLNQYSLRADTMWR